MTPTPEQRAELRRQRFDLDAALEAFGNAYRQPGGVDFRAVEREYARTHAAIDPLLDAADERDRLAKRVAELEEALERACSDVVVAYMHRREPDLAGKSLLSARGTLISVLPPVETTPRTPEQVAALDELTRLGWEIEYGEEAHDAR